MAHEDLLDLGPDELGHLLYLNITSPVGIEPERVAAIKDELANRGLWYCYHDDSVQELPMCRQCGRQFDYMTNSDA